MGQKTGVNLLVKTPDSSIFCVANVKQLTNFDEYSLYFKNQLGLLVFCFVQSKNSPPPVQPYLLTYYPTGTRVPDKLPGRVPA